MSCFNTRSMWVSFFFHQGKGFSDHERQGAVGKKKRLREGGVFLLLVGHLLTLLPSFGIENRFFPTITLCVPHIPFLSVIFSKNAPL